MHRSFQHAQPSALARQLARWQPQAANTPRQDVAERLGQWLTVAEAIQLHAALGKVGETGAGAVRPGASPALTALHAELAQELQRVRGVLTRSIGARDRSHQPDPNDLDTEFAFFHQHLNEQQHRMELSVDALRGHVRQRLAQVSPALARLAALDEVMDSLFGGREQRLLTSLLPHLRARFSALRQAARSADQPDDLRWLQTFAAEFEQALLAELDLRLQPVTGLIEALEAA